MHRLRIGDWKPAGIKSITCDPHSNMVAIGRFDGGVEIVDSANKWYILLSLLPIFTSF